MKKIIFAMIFLIIAIGAVGASDVNSTDNMISQNVAIDDTTDNEDVLGMDEDFFDETDDSSDDDSNARLEIVEEDLNSDNKYVKIKLTNKTDGSPIPGIDLGVVTSETVTTGMGSVKKIITNTQGMATYYLPFKSGTESITVGLYCKDGDSEGLTKSDGTIKVNFLKKKITFEDIKAKLNIAKKGSTYKDTILTVTLFNNTNNALANEEISLKFSNGVEKKLKTDSSGKVTYIIPFKPGTYSVTASVASSGVSAKKVTLKGIKITKASAALVPTKLKTTYQSGKPFNVKVTNTKSKRAMKGVNLVLKVYAASKYKKVTLKTDSNGIASFDTSKLSLGFHKIVASVKDSKYISAKSKTSSVKITKAAITLSAPSISGETLKVTVKNKESKKGMKGVNVSIKVYTGSSYQTLTAKTNAKGVAIFSTKTISYENHDAVVSVKGNSNYKSASKTCSLTFIRIATQITINDVHRYSSNGTYHLEFQLSDADNGPLANKTVTVDTDIYVFDFDPIVRTRYVTTDSNGCFNGDINAISGGDTRLVAHVIFNGDVAYDASEKTVNVN